MSDISVRFKSPYDGFYKTFGAIPRDATHTHIATGAHGFESLCCSELDTETLEAAEPLADGKVTCPGCQSIWRHCQVFTATDFQITE